MLIIVLHLAPLVDIVHIYGIFYEICQPTQINKVYMEYISNSDTNLLHWSSVLPQAPSTVPHLTAPSSSVGCCPPQAYAICPLLSSTKYNQGLVCWILSLSAMPSICLSIALCAVISFFSRNLVVVQVSHP